MVEVSVSVKAMAGGIICGPVSIPESENILVVRRLAADHMQVDPYEISLLHDAVQLADETSFAEAGVINDTMLTAVRLDAVEAQGRLLARFLELATPTEGGISRLRELSFEDSREWRQTEDKEQSLESDGKTWLAELASACACREVGLPRDVEAMLEAIFRCGKAFGQKSFVMSASEIKSDGQGAGLLCIESKSCETGFRRTLVDLTGELAALFGKPAEQYKGAVWISSVSEDDWDILAHPFKIHEGSSISKWRDVIHYSRENNMPQLLPLPVALSIRGFFSMWLATGECPAFFFREEVLAARQEIADLDTLHAAYTQCTETMARLAREQETEKTRKENRRVLQGIFSYLDQSGKHCLSSSEMKGLWEIGGWIAADSDEAEVHNTFSMVCKEKGFDIALGCSKEAFMDCFLCMPPSEDLRDYICADAHEIPTSLLEEFLATLVSGPEFGTHYLAFSKRWDLLRPAMLHDIFCLLDRNADGHLGSLEFRHFMEMAAGSVSTILGWSSKLVKPWMREWAGEGHALEVWQEQFREFCEARNLFPETGLTESDFVKYADDCAFTDLDLLFFMSSNLRAGQPPTGHYISYGDFTDALMIGDAIEAATMMGYGNSFNDAYTWCLQCLSDDAGSPRSLCWSSGGVEYSILAVPYRDRLPEKWKLIEISPRRFEWQLVRLE